MPTSVENARSVRTAGYLRSSAGATVDALAMVGNDWMFGMNDGSGNFTWMPTQGNVTGDLNSFHLGDVDGDGLTDIVYQAWIETSFVEVVMWKRNLGGRLFADPVLVQQFNDSDPLDLGDPRLFTVADFDGNGEADVAIFTRRAAVFYARNLGAGLAWDHMYLAKLPHTGDAEPTSLFSVDLAGDTLPSFVMCHPNPVGPYVAMFRALNGTHFHDVEFIINDYIFETVLGSDFDGDGYADILALPSGTATVAAIRFGDPALPGALLPTQLVTIQQGGIGATAVDLNGDGNTDVLLAPNAESMGVRALISSGIRASPFIADVVVTYSGDFDKKLDDVVAGMFDPTGNRITGFAFDDNGWPNVMTQFFFEAPSSPMVTAPDAMLVGSPGFTLGMRVADVNGDGTVDIVAGTTTGVMVIASQGQGEYLQQGVKIMDITTVAVGVADFSAPQDGWLDACACNVFNGDVAVTYAQGGGEYGESVALGKVDSSVGENGMLVGCWQVETADIGGDGQVDCIVHTRHNYTWAFNPRTPGAPPLRLGPPVSYAAVTADLTGNGFTDVAFYSYLERRISWQRASPSGTLGPVTLLTVLPEPAGNVTDEDVPVFKAIQTDLGVSLLVALNYDNDTVRGCNMYLVPAAGGGSFGAPMLLFNVASSIRSMAIADVNKDGRDDFILSMKDEVWLSVATNTSFEAPGKIKGPTDLATMNLHLADINKDGLDDVVAIEDDSSPRIVAYIQEADLTHLRVRDTRTVVAYPECAGQITSRACFYANTARMSSCGTTALTLLPESSACTVGGTSHVTIDGFNVELFGAEGGSTVDCGNASSPLFASLASDVPFAMQDVALVASPPEQRPEVVVAQYPVTTSAIETMGGETQEIRFKRVNVTGFVYPQVNPFTPYDAGIGGVITLGSKVSLWVEDSWFADNAVVAIGGVIGVVGDSVSLSVYGSTFFNNSVLGSSETIGNDGGGAIAVIGTNAEVHVSNSLFSHNTASGGAGGALLVRPSAMSARIRLTETRMLGNSAQRMGGAVAVVGADSDIEVTVAGSCVADANAAMWGGTVALVNQEVGAKTAFPTQVSSVRLLRGDPVVGSTVVDFSASILSSYAVGFGGIAFSCGGRLNMSQATHSESPSHPAVAGVAGAFLFSCATSSPSGVPLGAWALLPPDLGMLDLQKAASYGARRATPPITMVASGIPASVVSGLALGGGVIELVDAYGQKAVDDSIVVSLGSPDANLFVTAGTLLPVTEDTSGASTETTVLAAAGFPASLGVPMVLRAVVESAVTGALIPDLDHWITVTGCPPAMGRVSSDDPAVPLVCSECTEGSYSNETSAAACETVVDCGADAYFLEGTCEQCPDNTVLVIGNDSSPICSCSPTYWTDNPNAGTQVTCLACPVGAICRGGSARPFAAPGYASVDGTFEACRFGTESCAGNGQCQTGYTGFLCKDCATNYYRGPESRCKKCPPAAVGLLALLLGIVVVAAVCAAILVVTMTVPNKKRDGRRKLVPHSLSTLLVFLQVVGLLGSAPLSWPSSVRSTMDSASVANLDLNLFASDCSLDNFALKYALSVLLPVVFAFFVAIGVLIMFAVRPSQVSPRRALERLLFVTGPLLFIPICKATLTLFDCHRLPDGRYYLDSDPAVQCGPGAWLSVLPLGIAAFIVYVVGMPTLFAAILWRQRNRLADPETQARFGPLFMLYRHHYYWYSVLLLLKRLGTVCAAVFFSNHIMWMIMGFVTVFAFAAYIQVRFSPFYEPIYNSLETRVNIAVLALIFIGGMFWARDGTMSSEAHTFLVVMAFMVLIGAVILIGIAMAQELRSLHARRKGTAPPIEALRAGEFWRIVSTHQPDLHSGLARQLDVLKEQGSWQGGDGTDPSDVVVFDVSATPTSYADQGDVAMVDFGDDQIDDLLYA